MFVHDRTPVPGVIECRLFGARVAMIDAGRHDRCGSPPTRPCVQPSPSSFARLPGEALARTMCGRRSLRPCQVEGRRRNMLVY